MIFFLDENVPKSSIKLLESKGHEVIDIRGTHFEGSDDSILFKIAQDKKAIFLTTDKDFFHTIPYLYNEHCGIIVIALKQPNRISILDKIQFFLDNIDIGNLNSKVVLLRDKHYTIL